MFEDPTGTTGVPFHCLDIYDFQIEFEQICQARAQEVRARDRGPVLMGHLCLQKQFVSNAFCVYMGRRPKIKEHIVEYCI